MAGRPAAELAQCLRQLERVESMLTTARTAVPFHHLMAVHRWGWQLTLHPDGTTTAVSPDRRRVLHTHGPPPATAA